MTPKPLSITPPAAYVPLLVQGVRLIVMPVVPQPPGHRWTITPSGNDWYMHDEVDGAMADWRLIKCPFGDPGDVFAVREKVAIYDDPPIIAYAADNRAYSLEIFENQYRHYNNFAFWVDDRPSQPNSERFRPARSMPLWAARLHYRTLSVAVRPVQTIAEEEAEAAGFKASHVGDGSSATDQFAAFFTTLYPQALTSNTYCYFAAVEVETKGH